MTKTSEELAADLLRLSTTYDIAGRPITLTLEQRLLLGDAAHALKEQNTEIARLRKLAYFEIPIPKLLRRKK